MRDTGRQIKLGGDIKIVPLEGVGGRSKVSAPELDGVPLEGVGYRYGG